MEKKMNEETIILKIYGFYFILSAILDIINVSFEFLKINKSDFLKNLPIDISKEFTIGILVFIIIMILILILIKVFLGIRGIQQANGTYKGTMHTTIAKICLVFMIIFMVPELFTNMTSIFDFISDICTIIILFVYIGETKKISNKKNNNGSLSNSVGETKN